jgi:hypothetical protein
VSVCQVGQSRESALGGSRQECSLNHPSGAAAVHDDDDYMMMMMIDECIRLRNVVGDNFMSCLGFGVIEIMR